MDSPQIPLNTNFPPTGESENIGSISPKVPDDDPRQMDKVDTCVEMLEGQNDEGVASDLPEGGNLQNDLLDAFRKEDFSFDGSFYHSSLLSTAVNPCLCISGLGLVGLPLSERDAKAIISRATLAPFGHGERTVVDKDVRDTWEIEPPMLSFLNPEWEDFVTKTVCPEVCKSLGVSLGDCPPKMELYKLLLYEQGSHFLPHQDTQKADGMFATVVIILPSAYTGGQVVISHATTTKTVDFSEKSLLSTAVLAWYTDVKHEVKAVASGYRFALSYNLIHIAPPNVPRPCLPNTSSSEALLAHVLKKWRAKKYEKGSERRIVAYLLDHEYTAVNLKEGLDGLKGVDAHRVTLLGPIAEHLGFVVGLASLSHKVSGCANDYGHGYRGSTPAMVEVIKKSTSISGFVDLTGASLLSVKNLNLSDDSLIPGNPFKGKKPDDAKYEGYLGNGAGQLDHWYRRTVVFLMNRDDVDDVCYETEGIPYAYGKLKESTTIPPTTQDRLWATRLVQRAKELKADQVTTLFEYAIRWKDLKTWKVLMKSSSCKLNAISRDLLHNAWRTFSFDAVRASFEVILNNSYDLTDQMEFIYSLPPRANGQELSVIRTWCNNQSLEIMSTYTTKTYSSPDIKDIPIILTVIQVEGLGVFMDTMLQNMLRIRGGSYAFWLAFRRALINEKDTLLGRVVNSLDVEMPSPPSTEITSDDSWAVLDKLTKGCLQVAALQWSDFHLDPMDEWFSNFKTGSRSSRDDSQNVKKRDEPYATRIERVMEVLEELIISGDVKFCDTLFEDLLKTPQSGSVGETITRLYAPLLPPLCALLVKLNQDVSAPPFVGFLREIIGLYLKNVLGDKNQLHNCLLCSVACGQNCDDCRLLDVFILDPTTTSKTFHLGYYDSARARQQHLRSQISTTSTKDLYLTETGHREDEYVLKFTKNPQVLQASQWETRLQNAMNLLASIGPDEFIDKIMGPRYEDVTQALSGEKPFGSSPAKRKGSRTARAGKRRKS